eukprot:360966-Chlamydomonas_euryale.AAC.1
MLPPRLPRAAAGPEPLLDLPLLPQVRRSPGVDHAERRDAVCRGCGDNVCGDGPLLAACRRDRVWAVCLPMPHDCVPGPGRLPYRAPPGRAKRVLCQRAGACVLADARAGNTRGDRGVAGVDVWMSMRGCEKGGAGVGVGERQHGCAGDGGVAGGVRLHANASVVAFKCMHAWYTEASACKCGIQRQAHASVANTSKCMQAWYKDASVASACKRGACKRGTQAQAQHAARLGDGQHCHIQQHACRACGCCSAACGLPGVVPAPKPPGLPRPAPFPHYWLTLNPPTATHPPHLTPTYPFPYQPAHSHTQSTHAHPHPAHPSNTCLPAGCHHRHLLHHPPGHVAGRLPPPAHCPHRLVCGGADLHPRDQLHAHGAVHRRRRWLWGRRREAGRRVW